MFAKSYRQESPPHTTLDVTGPDSYVHEQIYLLEHIFRFNIGCHSGLTLVGASVRGWNLAGTAALRALSLVASLS